MKTNIVSDERMAEFEAESRRIMVLEEVTVRYGHRNGD